MLKHLVPMMKKMARPLLARRGAAQYPEHDLALAATFLWVIERHSGIFFLLFVGGCGGGVGGNSLQLGNAFTHRSARASPSA